MISATTIRTPPELLGFPDLAHVLFDMRRLEVQGIFSHAEEPEYQVGAYCLFAACHGFRVLNEADLLEFWEPDTRQPGWLWQIHSGGWLDQEMQREGFFDSRPKGSGWPAPKEFLVLGMEFCVSVLAHREPLVWVAEPFTGAAA